MHLLRDMDMTVAKKEKLQLVIQFAGRCGALRLRESTALSGRSASQILETPEDTELVTFLPTTGERGT